MELETLSRSFETHNQAVTGALDDMKTRLSELEKSHAREVPSDYTSDGVRTWGAEFAASDEYKSYVAGGMKGRAALHVKDALTTAPTSRNRQKQYGVSYQYGEHTCGIDGTVWRSGVHF